MDRQVARLTSAQTFTKFLKVCQMRKTGQQMDRLVVRQIGVPTHRVSTSETHEEGRQTQSVRQAGRQTGRDR